MSPQHAAGPRAGKEDVAGALNFREELEARTDEPFRVGLAQRMIEICERLTHPRLATPVLEQPEALERRAAHLPVGRERRHHERKARLSIRILRPIELRPQDLLPARHLAYGQLHCHHDLVGLDEWKAGDLLVTSPHTLEPAHAV